MTVYEWDTEADTAMPNPEPDPLRDAEARNERAQAALHGIVTLIQTGVSIPLVVASWVAAIRYVFHA